MATITLFGGNELVNAGDGDDTLTDTAVSDEVLVDLAVDRLAGGEAADTFNAALAHLNGRHGRRSDERRPDHGACNAVWQ